MQGKRFLNNPLSDYLELSWIDKFYEELKSGLNYYYDKKLFQNRLEKLVKKQGFCLINFSGLASSLVFEIGSL